MIITSRSPNEYAFISLADCKEKFPEVKKAYMSVFGEQVEVLEDIQKRKNRKTELLTHNGKAVGVVVYKRELSRSDDCLELSLVSLFDTEDEKKGYRSQLFERVEAVAKELHASSAACTLPPSAQNQIAYFQHKGYQLSDKAQEVVLSKVFEQKRR
ncbi:MAG: hypothetical protein LLF94_05350, partial [Chlamydiales bacterium]|nr:hypothetical protein [Chlamydiales bacterium]